MNEIFVDMVVDAIVASLEEAVGAGLISDGQAGRLRGLYIRILREKVKNLYEKNTD